MASRKPTAPPPAKHAAPSAPTAPAPAPIRLSTQQTVRQADVALIAETLRISARQTPLQLAVGAAQAPAAQTAKPPLPDLIALIHSWANAPSLQKPVVIDLPAPPALPVLPALAPMAELLALPDLVAPISPPLLVMPTAASAASAPFVPTPATLTVQPEPAAPHSVSTQLAWPSSLPLHVILGLEREAFIAYAYRLCLGREAEPSAVANGLAQLEGGVGKTLYLGRLRYSPEGVQQAAKIPGLALRYGAARLAQVPLIGPVLRTGAAWAVSAQTLTRVRRTEQALALQLATAQAQHAAFAAQHATLAAQHAAAAAHNAAALAAQQLAMAAQQAQTAEVIQHIHLLQGQLTTLGERAAQQLTHQRTEWQAQQHTLYTQLQLTREALATQLHSGLSAQAQALNTLAHEQWLAHLQHTESGAELLRQLVQNSQAERHTQRLAANETKAQVLQALDTGTQQMRTELVRQQANSLRLAQQSQQDQAATQVAQVAQKSALQSEIQAAAQANQLALTQLESQQKSALQSEIQAAAQTNQLALAQLESQQNQASAEISQQLTAQQQQLEVANGLHTSAQATARAEVAQLASELAAEVNFTGQALGRTSATEALSQANIYADFERRHRGTFELIAARLGVYLQFLESSSLDLRNERIVDLGCGRGDWLDVLKQHGYSGEGVDLNLAFVEEVRGRGHTVHAAHLLDFLSATETASVGCVSVFHVVEHLLHIDLLRLLAAARRVLKPGGLLILETPNPENLSVGACNFYMDPTHLHPIPPLLLDHLVDHSGFARHEIIRLSNDRGLPSLASLPAEHALASVVNPLVNLAQWNNYGPPDYAVIGHVA